MEISPQILNEKFLNQVERLLIDASEMHYSGNPLEKQSQRNQRFAEVLNEIEGLHIEFRKELDNIDSDRFETQQIIDSYDDFRKKSVEFVHAYKGRILGVE